VEAHLLNVRGPPPLGALLPVRQDCLHDDLTEARPLWCFNR
jgi:hypothetical protein